MRTVAMYGPMEDGVLFVIWVRVQGTAEWYLHTVTPFEEVHHQTIKAMQSQGNMQFRKETVAIKSPASPPQVTEFINDEEAVERYAADANAPV